ncbi:MAG: ABC transporter ATP-binding protein [Armatimonadota bacterium]|jgi:ATP-binding cassette subfamily B protein|nr:ABC transporter ATP-binding protein [candidate division WS1 bacterium]
MGASRTVGGLPRTYGLQRHFSRDRGNGPTPQITRARVRRVLRYFRPYRWQWATIIATIAVTAGLSQVNPLLTRHLIDDAMLGEDKRLLVQLASAMVGVAVVLGLLGVVQHTLAAKAGQSMIHDVRSELYQHLQRMSLRFYTSSRSGEIVSRINNDVNAVQGVATGTVTQIANNLCMVVATSAALLYLSPALTLVAVAIVPFFYIPSKIVGRISQRLATLTMEAQASMQSFMHERLHVGGVLLTKICGRGPDDAGIFGERSRRLVDLHVRSTIVGRWLFMVLSIFAVLGPALVYWYGGLQVIEGLLTAGTVIAVAALMTNLYRPLLQLATVYVDIQASLGVFERIFEYLDMLPEVRDREDATPLPTTGGEIRFSGVNFAYPSPMLMASDRDGREETEEAADGFEPEREAFSLQDVSFRIAPGEQVALVGPSGAGKTTITYLVPRFYDPDEGTITLDGHDLRDLRQDDLRQHIGMVTQETFLFHASVIENLRYAKPDATEEEIVAATRAANIHDFIAELPEGYDTVVGERGFRLSGGEKQRLSIARALLKDPAILVLDEATSSLDSTSEHLIQEALETLLRGRTAIIIAHRLSTVLGADKILVMEKGRLVQVGSHEGLVEEDGLYSQLFTRQFGRVLDLT